MLRVLLPRLVQAVAVLLLSSIIVFVIIRLVPGDPAVVELGPQAEDPRYQEMIEAKHKELGLDQPILVQYLMWLRRVVGGDLGSSARNKEPVLDLILAKLPATVELVAGGMTFALLVALPLGVLAALRHKGIADGLIRVITLIGVALPPFWLGLLLLLIFAVSLRWLPSARFVPIWQDPVEGLRHLILPAISLGAYEMAAFTRFLRAQMLDVLSQDYIRTAEAKGLHTATVILRHALRNAVLPLITVVGLEVGLQLGGTVIIEQIYGWPGIGWLALQAINNRDYPLIQGIVLLAALFVTLSNLVVDLMYGLLDPRIRLAGEQR
jgi:peptide/nickel transport system permease protein